MMTEPRSSSNPATGAGNFSGKSNCPHQIKFSLYAHFSKSIAKNQEGNELGLGSWKSCSALFL